MARRWFVQARVLGLAGCRRLTFDTYLSRSTLRDLFHSWTEDAIPKNARYLKYALPRQLQIGAVRHKAFIDVDKALAAACEPPPRGR